MYSTRTTCRLCEGDLKEILSLGDIHLSTFVDTNDSPPPKIPIDLMQCILCDCMQLRHTVDSDIMYDDYWYQSGLNQSMRDALKDVVDKAQQYVTIEEANIVVDIGANDGTLLENYDTDVWTVGFEPNKLAQLGEHKCDLMINDYFSAKLYNQYQGDRAHIITAIAMFYDLENPHTFVDDLREVLHKDGVCVIQMMDLLSMLQYTDFTNLCHEHLIYYSLKTFTDLMTQHGLEVFHVEYNGVNGGSLRAYIQHPGTRPINNSVSKALTAEQEYFDTIGDVAEYFRRNIEVVKDAIVNFIHELNRRNLSVAVLGASTKGNTLLQYFGLNETHIVHAAEINKDKFGKRTVGTNIPIISQTESLEYQPSYYLILPWGFIDNFVDKFNHYLVKGGTFIVPLPYPRTINIERVERPLI